MNVKEKLEIRATCALTLVEKEYFFLNLTYFYKKSFFVRLSQDGFFNLFGSM